MRRVAVIDLRAVLDRSRPGRAGAKVLQTWYERARAKATKPSDLLRLRAALEKKRAELAAALVEEARPVIREVAKRRGASLVLERRQVVAAPARTDITREVIARLAG